MSEKAVLTDERRRLIFINILISCIASSMLATALTTALPSMIEDLNISVNMGQWLTSGYSLAMGIMMPLTAFLITRFPTRRLYLTAILCFMAGLVICVLSTSFPIMMAGRVLQAGGNGILTSMTQVILLSIYPAEKKGSVMGWYGLSVGAAPVIAPTVAGVIVDNFGWRMIFVVAIAVMAVSLIFAVCVFDNVLDVTKKRFDIVSFILSIFAFGGITLGVGNIGSYPFVSVQVLLILVVGCVAAAVFVYRQLSLDKPFLDLRILRSKNYALSVIGSMILYLVMMGSSILLPLYVQTIMGYSAVVSGLVAMPGSVAMAVVSPFAGKIYDKIGMKALFVAGAFFMMISNVGMFFINMQTKLWFASGLNVIRCVSIGCLMMPLVTWGTSFTGKGKTADATALLTSLRTISGAVGSAVFVGIMSLVTEAARAYYGESAAIHGLNAAFGSMAFFSFVLLMIAVFGVKKSSE